MAFVLSQKAHAIIKQVDYEPALAVDGVVDVVTYRDIPENGSNTWNFQHDQFVFAVDEVSIFLPVNDRFFYALSMLPFRCNVTAKSSQALLLRMPRPRGELLSWSKSNMRNCPSS